MTNQTREPGVLQTPQETYRSHDVRRRLMDDWGIAHAMPNRWLPDGAWGKQSPVEGPPPVIYQYQLELDGGRGIARAIFLGDGSEMERWSL